jgi:adenylate kinase family enzyme
MQRVLVIGSGGAGKSTFAAQLARATGLPLVHLDAVYWRTGWVKTPKAQWAAVVEAMIREPRWIIDGNYGGTLELRRAACDTVVFLDRPRLLCLARVVKRFVRFRKQSRPDVTPGCPDRITMEFLWWIWGYPRRRRPEIMSWLARMRAIHDVQVLRTDADVEEFLRRTDRDADSGRSPNREGM